MCSGRIYYARGGAPWAAAQLLHRQVLIERCGKVNRKLLVECIRAQWAASNDRLLELFQMDETALLGVSRQLRLLTFVLGQVLLTPSCLLNIAH